MDRATPTASHNASGASTPASHDPNSRFTAQNATAEDLLKSQTVGLVQLSDFRKRRAEALEQKEREATQSGAATPTTGASTPQQQRPLKKKKRKNAVAKGKLSFGIDDDDEVEEGARDTDGAGQAISNAASAVATPARSASATPASEPQPQPTEPSTAASGANDDDDGADSSSSAPPPRHPRRPLGPNARVVFAPRVQTKAALQREAATREQLRRQFLARQELVRETAVAIPFVFYDGTNVPGGVCRVKKGDAVWLFLDKARKVGAELAGGAGGAGGDTKSRREWARVGVDDLMLVRGELIIPHHYDFYYFIVNKTIGFNGPLFPYSSEPDSTSIAAGSGHSTPTEEEATQGLIVLPERKKKANQEPASASLRDEQLEGGTDDPSVTKVVDRRWYERNKHIFPASVWEEFDPGKDYTSGIRRDAQGNAFFF